MTVLAFDGEKDGFVPPDSFQRRRGKQFVSTYGAYRPDGSGGNHPCRDSTHDPDRDNHHPCHDAQKHPAGLKPSVEYVEGCNSNRSLTATTDLNCYPLFQTVILDS